MKQETLEEAAEEFYSEQSKSYEDEIEPMFDTSRYLVAGFIDGAKWQAERMYSEEDLKRAFEAGHKKGFSGYPNTENWKELPFEKWFEQFKKK